MKFNCLVIGENSDDQIDNQEEKLRLEREHRMFLAQKLDEYEKWNTCELVEDFELKTGGNSSSALKKDIKCESIKIGAIIFNETWYEMDGYYYRDNNSIEFINWVKKVNDIIDSLPDDTLLTIYRMYA